MAVVVKWGVVVLVLVGEEGKVSQQLLVIALPTLGEQNPDIQRSCFDHTQ